MAPASQEPARGHGARSGSRSHRPAVAATPPRSSSHLLLLLLLAVLNIASPERWAGGCAARGGAAERLLPPPGPEPGPAAPPLHPPAPRGRGGQTKAGRPERARCWWGQRVVSHVPAFHPHRGQRRKRKARGLAHPQQQRVKKSLCVWFSTRLVSPP